MSPAATVLMAQAERSMDDAQTGAMLTELYRRTQSAALAILRFGVAFWWVENQIESRSATRGGSKLKRKGSGFSGWLREHAPKVAESTARRYRDIARALAECLELGDSAQMMALLSADPGQLKPAQTAKREQTREWCECRSVRAMQQALGLAEHPAGLAGREATVGKERAPIQHASLVRRAVVTLSRALPVLAEDEEQAAAYADLAPEVEQRWRQVLDALPPRLWEIIEHARRARRAGTQAALTAEGGAR